MVCGYLFSGFRGWCWWFGLCGDWLGVVGYSGGCFSLVG